MAGLCVVHLLTPTGQPGAENPCMIPKTASQTKHIKAEGDCISKKNHDEKLFTLQKLQKMTYIALKVAGKLPVVIITKKKKKKRGAKVMKI